MLNKMVGVHSSKLVMCALVFLLLVDASAWAQITTNATITGTVTDSTGALIPQATIAISNQQTGVERRSQSNSDGNYIVPELPAGLYTLTVTAQGFQTFREADIGLSAAQVTTTNVVLKVGKVETTVDVVASTVAVQTKTPEISHEVTGEQMATLPLNGRSYVSLSVLMPGATNVNPDQSIAQGSQVSSTLAMNGMGTGGEQYYLDGVLDQNLGAAGQLIINPNPDTVEEVKVLNSNYGAQYSLNQANAVLLQTKEGTRDFHGSGYEYFRNDALQARNFFSASVLPDKQSFFGYTLGGPVMIPGHFNTKRDKVFFFWSQQWFDQHLGSVVRGADPTAAMRNGLFPTAITNPATGMPFPEVSGSYQIPSTMISANSLTFLNALAPLPNNPSGGFTNFSNANPAINHTRDDEIKGDYSFTPKIRLTAEYLDERQNFKNPYLTSTMTWPTNWEYIVYPSQMAQTRLTQILSPSMVNSASLSVSIFIANFPTGGLIYQDQIPDFHEVLPYAGYQSDRLPVVTFSAGWAPLGVNQEYPLFHASDMPNTFSDDWSWLRGKHYLQAGMLIEKTTTRQTDYAATNGSWTFSGQFTGSPIADFLLGDAATFTQYSSELRVYEHSTILSPYFQDQWKITKRLTLTGGLRLLHSPFGSAQRGFSNFDHTTFNPADAPIVNPNGTITPTANWNPLNGIVFNGVTPGAPLNYANRHLNYFNPTFGFAYDIFGDGKTSLRGGYGMTHSQGTLGATCQFQCPNNYPLTTIVSLVTPSFPNPTGAKAAPLTGQTMEAEDQNQRENDIQTYSLSVEHQFRGAWLFSLAGVGDIARHVAGQPDLNQPLPSGGYNFNPLINTGKVSEYYYAPYQGYDALITFTSEGNVLWNALEANLRHPVGHGLFLTVAYTYQHGLSDSRGTGIVSGATPQDIYNPGDNYGTSNSDVTHVFNTSAIWTIPWLANSKGWKKLILGGWQYSDFTTLQTGFALDPAISTSTKGLATRPNRVLSNVTGPRTATDWFNTAAFAAPAAGFFGNAAPGSIRGPGLIDFDMSLHKAFPVGERKKFIFRAECFNIFNITNFNAVSTSLGAGNFGQVTTAHDPRIFEFALRFEF